MDSWLNVQRFEAGLKSGWRKSKIVAVAAWLVGSINLLLPKRGVHANDTVTGRLAAGSESTSSVWWNETTGGARLISALSQRNQASM